MNASTKIGDFTVVTYFDVSKWNHITSIHDQDGHFVGPKSLSLGDEQAKLDHIQAILWVEDNYQIAYDPAIETVAYELEEPCGP